MVRFPIVFIVSIVTLIILKLENALADSFVEEVQPVPPDNADTPNVLETFPGQHVAINTVGNAYSLHYNDFDLSLDDSQSYCEQYGGELAVIDSKQYGGELAVIDSKAKSDIVVRLFKKARGYHNPAWILARYQAACGVYRDGNRKIFYQTDVGLSVGYSHWATDEPQPQNGNCVVVDPALKYKWRAEDCTTEHAFICEWGHCGKWWGNPSRCNRTKGCGYQEAFEDENYVSDFGGCYRS